MQETLICFLGQEESLEKDMATHSSILAWRIPMERGAWAATVHGVPKSQHDWVTKRTHMCARTHTHTHSTERVWPSQARVAGRWILNHWTTREVQHLHFNQTVSNWNLVPILFLNIGYSDYNKFRTLPKLCSKLSEYSWQSSWRQAVHDRKFFLFNYVCNMQ